MKIPEITLNDGNKIPQVGLGMWQVTDEKDLKVAFNTAIKSGYRHFDTAQAYNNEAQLGSYIKESTIDRKNIFITTKIDIRHFTKGLLNKSFTESLKNLQTDYIDLLLLHFPVTGLRKSAWIELEKLRVTGQAKSIGVSNYTIRHLEHLQKYAQITPAINQVELHVFLQQPELLDYCHQHNIVVEAYSPLAHAKALHEPMLSEMAKKYGKSPAQIMLRWCIQRNLVIVPKSVTPSRIQENIDIFDFELVPSDMGKLKTLNTNFRTCWDPTLVP